MLVYFNPISRFIYQGDPIMHSIKLFFSTLIFFFLIDMTWLGFVAKNIYAENIGLLLRKSGETLAPNWYAAICVYILFAIGILVFVLPNASGNYLKALMYGAIFGLVIYGIYDLTNYSLLANWPLRITLIDMVWGTFLCALVSLFATFMQNLFK
jgi:uncharacterized membrane protein